MGEREHRVGVIQKSEEQKEGGKCSAHSAIIASDHARSFTGAVWWAIGGDMHSVESSVHSTAASPWTFVKMDSVVFRVTQSMHACPSDTSEHSFPIFACRGK